MNIHDCPNCESERVKVASVLGVDGLQVHCHRCGMRGPCAVAGQVIRSRDVAIHAWNRIASRDDQLLAEITDTQNQLDAALTKLARRVD